MDIVKKVKDFIAAFKRTYKIVDTERCDAEKKIRVIKEFIQRLKSVKTGLDEMGTTLSRNLSFFTSGAFGSSFWNVWKATGYGDYYIDSRKEASFERTDDMRKHIEGGLRKEIDYIRKKSLMHLEICEKYYKAGEYQILLKQFDSFKKDIEERQEYSHVNFKDLYVLAVEKIIKL